MKVVFTVHKSMYQITWEEGVDYNDPAVVHNLLRVKSRLYDKTGDRQFVLRGHYAYKIYRRKS